MSDGNGASQADLEAGVSAIREVARRGAAAARFQSRTEERLLQLIVDATVSLFQAQAASIALFLRDPDRLEYRVAGGAETGDVVGMSVPPTQGIVGYVYSTGESVALTDISKDPRFDRATAEKTGYVPRSVAAVPLVTEEQVVGVLEVFDKATGETFSVRDMEVLAAFGAQAGAAIQGTRVQHDLPVLLANTFRQLAPDMSDAQVNALVSTATRELDVDEETQFWALVDQVSSLRGLGDSELELVGDILQVVAAHKQHRARFGRSSPR
ncbi:MAG TPA: GAF domain-containing protein [Candidatus Limnocylindria bacterium]|jgi:GAF domain-containing protein|nr:GAF domain-containing protein [Candidatus Limnocylindria bacterium]